MAERHAVLAAKSGGMVFAGRLFVWGARFVLAVLLARLLGADSYGLYNIALTVATLGAAFSVIGLDSALVRYVAVYTRRSDRAGVLGTLRVGIGLPMLASLLAAGVLLLLAEPIANDLIGDPRLETMIRIAALLVPAMVANSLLSAALTGAMRIGWAVLAEQFAQPIVRAALLLTFALVGLTPELAILASTLSTIVVTGLLLLFVQRQISLDGVRTQGRVEAGELIRFSLPVYFSNVVTTVGGSLQTLVLGAMASVASAGIFSVANHIMLIGATFHSSIVQASMPIFAQLQDVEDRRPLDKLYRTTSKWTMTLNLPFFLVAIIFSEALLSIFGSDFTDGVSALRILAFASLVNAATGTSGAMLDMTGHTRVKLVNSTISVGLSIALSLLLIPAFGIVGAAVSVVGAVSSVNLLRVGEVLWLVHVGPYDRSWLKPVAAGAAAGAVGVLVSMALSQQGLALQALVGIACLGATYAGSLIALGLDEEDRMVLSRAARRFRRGRGERRTIEPRADAASPDAPKEQPS